MALQIESPLDLYNRENFNEYLEFGKNSGRELGNILSAYTFSKDNEIKCGIQSCRQSHQKGYLVTTSDGLETIIGNLCGKKHLGEDFTRKTKIFRDDQLRESNLKTIEKLKHLLDPLCLAIDDLKPRASRLFQLKMMLSHTARPLLKLVSERAKVANPIITGLVPMTEAEAKREYFNHADGEKIKFPEWYQKTLPKKRVPVAKLNGLPFFMQDLHKVLQQDVINPLNEIVGMQPGDAEKLKKKKLQELSTWATRHEVLLIRARDLVISGEAFFTPENIASLKFLLRELSHHERDSISEAIESLKAAA
jgi:hypothetical protein